MDHLFVFFICLENVLMMVCWVALAVHFEKWWIALFAILCFTSWKQRSNDKKES